MKKVIPVVLAAMLAIGFSAFTPSKTEDVYYKNPDSDELHFTTVTPCPEVLQVQCTKFIPIENGIRPLFRQDGTPYLKANN